MARYRLSREAEQDLTDIGRYTQRQWGVDQRRKYLRQLDRRMAFLAEHPQRGTKRDDVRAGYRSFREGRHLIFYRESVGTIEVIRVLHERMDPIRHLSTGVGQAGADLVEQSKARLIVRRKRDRRPKG